MSFLNDYDKFFPEKIWSSIKSYEDFIIYLINKHCPEGSYIYEDGDMKRGYFAYEDKMYTIRTWTIHDTPKGAKVQYSIFPANMTVEEALKYKDMP